MKSSPFISKSKYLNGLQCDKLLWYYYNAKDEIPETDAAKQAIFDQGHIVGEFAKKLFPDGLEVAEGIVDFQQVIEHSKELIKHRKPLFEAAFMFDNGYARADILVPSDHPSIQRLSSPNVSIGDLRTKESNKNRFPPTTRGNDNVVRWDIIEVKSSTQVKDINLHDLALQWYTYSGAGLELRKCHLMHINNQYVRSGDVDPKQLFVTEDVTDQVMELLPDIKKNLKRMRDTIAQKKSPDVPIGAHCSDPYDCAMTEVCWKFLPEHNPTTLYYAKAAMKFSLIEEGYIDLKKLPSSVALSDKQRIQIDSIRSRKPYINTKAIKGFLDTLEYPLYYLDFETIGPAIPLFNKSKPYQQIPFQFSIHIQDSPGKKPRHVGFLAEGKIDPRPELLALLKKNLGTKGSIVTYNASFERDKLNKAVEVYAEYKKWNSQIQERIVDLLDPFKAFHFYHYSQMGSASIKKVLPALTGKGYDELEIADGGTASGEYLRVTFGEEVTEKERSKVRNDLEKYCALDTEGMVWIVDELGKRIH